MHPPLVFKFFARFSNFGKMLLMSGGSDIPESFSPDSKRSDKAIDSCQAGDMGSSGSYEGGEMMQYLSQCDMARTGKNSSHVGMSLGASNTETDANKAAKEQKEYENSNIR